MHWWLLYLVFEASALALVVFVAVWGYFYWDRRYHGAAGPAQSFAPTDEVFRDPSTGRMMRVYFNAQTGERQYRESH